MADSHSLPVQSKSPRTSIQGSINKDDDGDESETKLPLELIEPLPRAPPKIDINALKNEILTDGMQVGATRELYSYIQLRHVYTAVIIMYATIGSSHRALYLWNIASYN